jgi:hypothetical protein
MNKLESQLIQQGYEYQEVARGVYLIPNFLTNNEINSVMSVINRASEDDWKTHYMQGVKDLAKRKYGRTDIDSLLEEGLIEITTRWIDKNLGLPHDISEPITERIKKIISFDPEIAFDGVGTIQRQYEGEPLIEHVDNHADPMIEYAVIMYINDDYNDGQLFFGKLGLEIVPPAKSMIIFPSGEDYLHGVKPPSAGAQRYVLPSFARRRKVEY